MNVVTLSLGKFPIGEHWYATLRGNDERQCLKEIPLSYSLTAAEAMSLNGDDYDGYREGDESERFFCAENARWAAVHAWKTHFPHADMLVEGSYSCAEPQRILDGGTPELQAIVEGWVKLGGFGPKAADPLCSKWQELTKPPALICHKCGATPEQIVIRMQPGEPDQNLCVECSG